MNMSGNGDLVLAFVGGIGVPELLVIFAIVLLLFGGKKLPEVARSMGGALRAFRDETQKMRHEIDLEAEFDHGSNGDSDDAPVSGAGSSVSQRQSAGNFKETRKTSGKSESDGEERSVATNEEGRTDANA